MPLKFLAQQSLTIAVAIVVFMGSRDLQAQITGALQIEGNYSQGPGGRLEIDVISTAGDGTGHDIIQVTEDANLDGTLEIRTGSSFTPAGGSTPGAIGDTFTIITAGNINGTFATVEGNRLGSGKFYSLMYNPTNLTLGAFQAQAGDVDGDQDVDITDFNTLAVNFDPVGANAGTNSWETADFDSDGDVDITDFNSLAVNFSPLGYGGDGPGQVPEPASLLLLATGCLALAFYSIKR